MNSKQKSDMTDAELSDKKRELLSHLEPQEVELLLDSVPKETRVQLVEQIETRMMYSGPIPHPELLKKFDEVIPNGADRIMQMAEKQSAHRMSLEKSIVDANNKDSHRGVLFAGWIGVIGVVGTVFLLAIGKSGSGVFVGAGTFTSLVAVYLKGTYLDKNFTGNDTKNETNIDKDKSDS